MKKLYQWKALCGDDLIDPPSIGPYYDCIDLDENFESKEEAIAKAKVYESAGGFCDLVLIEIYELSPHD